MKKNKFKKRKEVFQAMVTAKSAISHVMSAHEEVEKEKPSTIFIPEALSDVIKFVTHDEAFLGVKLEVWDNENEEHIMLSTMHDIDMSSDMLSV